MSLDTMPGTVPGTVEAPLDLTPPAPPADSLPPGPPAPDTKPKRPTTRAGRAAASAARKADKAAKGDKAPKVKNTGTRKANLETRLTGSLVSLGTVVAAAGAVAGGAVQADGVAIIQHAPNIASALDKVAQNDPRVKDALERMLTAGTWSGLIGAMLPLVLTIAANHGAIPAPMAAMLGVTTPPATDLDPPAPQTGMPVV